MIRLDDISLGYGTREIISHATAHFAEGELCALVGRNGAGKSTLLRAIISGTEQRIMLNGRTAGTLSAAERARTVAYVGTERIRVANLRCEDVVAIGRAPYTNWIGHLQHIDRQVVSQALDMVGMSNFATRCCDTLSDGEMQRIMIARAIAQQTPIILLDEPTAFLDIPTRFDLCRLLRSLAHEQRKCILFSTHDIDAAMPACDSIAIIENRALRKLAAAEAATEIEQLFKR